MTVLSVHGLDAKARAELKARAASEGASVNAFVLRLIEQGLGHRRARPALRHHDDLDALAGTWRNSEATAFERALEHGAALLTRDAHFAHIDGLRCGQRLDDLLP